MLATETPALAVAGRETVVSAIVEEPIIFTPEVVR